MRSYFLSSIVVLGILGVTPGGVRANAQEESPLHITLYLFSISAGQMDSMLEDGLTRAELTRLQDTIFVENTLLPGEGPLVVRPGDNDVKVPLEAINRIENRSDHDYVVFMYFIERLEGRNSATINTVSYALGEEHGEEVKVREREKIWRFPAEANRYRYIDFRYAQMMQYLSFEYNVSVQTGGETFDYDISFDLSGE